MTYELMIAFSLFAFVSSITPGPNNLMLMASGVNFGVWRTIPHILGISIGFIVMVLLVGVGIFKIFEAFPISYKILKIISVVYLLYLAWKIANAASVNISTDLAKPMTFLQAAAFQWVNPKAWTMALTAISVYSYERTFSEVLLVAIVFGVINLPSVGLWAVLGQQMARFINNPRWLVIFNRLMAFLLIISIYPVIWTE